VIARDSDGHTLGAGHDVSTESQALNSLADTGDLSIGGVRAHYH